MNRRIYRSAFQLSIVLNKSPPHLNKITTNGVHFGSAKYAHSAVIHSNTGRNSTLPISNENENHQNNGKLPKRPQTEALTEEANRCYANLDSSFENTKIAYKAYSNGDIIRALLVFRMCSNGFLVRNNQALMKTLRRVVGQTLFRKLMKSTFFGHFVAGENVEEVRKTVERLSACGVKSILDYSVESDISEAEAEAKAVHGEVGSLNEEVIADASGVDRKAVDLTHQRFSVHKEFGDRRRGVHSARTYFYESEKQCDRNADIFCEAIDVTADATQSSGFIALKLTALGRPQLLMKLSEVIEQTQLFFEAITGKTRDQLVYGKISGDSLESRLKELGIKTDRALIRDWFQQLDRDQDGVVDFYEWGRLLDRQQAGKDGGDIDRLFRVLNLKSGKLEPLVIHLSEAEKQNCANMMDRLVRIADYANSKGIRIMIDAEQTYFQPAINRLALALMRKYNTNGGVILNTYQTYLKSALNSVRMDMHIARREGFHFACKLVRGAYIEQERQRALAIGYEDPINENYEATSAQYRACLSEIIDEWRQRGNFVSVMIASHNADTVRYAVELMRENGISPNERVCCFGQLYAMSDQISFSLGHAGYSVYKYLPYGPVEEVLPYLSRRALENGSMLDKVGKERALLWTELKRRLGSGQLFYRAPTLPTPNGKTTTTTTEKPIDSASTVSAH